MPVGSNGGLGFIVLVVLIARTQNACCGLKNVSRHGATDATPKFFLNSDPIGSWRSLRRGVNISRSCLMMLEDWVGPAILTPALSRAA